MIIEKTGRTKICTDCGTVAHNTVMQSHVCEIQPLFNDIKPKKAVKKTVKKPTKKTKK